jgi:hypothetical protein
VIKGACVETALLRLRLGLFYLHGSLDSRPLALHLYLSFKLNLREILTYAERMTAYGQAEIARECRRCSALLPVD